MSNKMENKRYFMFVYSYWIPNDNGKGNLCFSFKKFPSHKDITLKAQHTVHKEWGTDKSDITIVIENWIEMSKEDFESFIE